MRCLILAVLLFATGLAAACSAPTRSYTCNVEPEAVAVEVHAVWTCNREVLRRAARKKGFSLREFHSAAAFFEKLTGLQVDSRPTHLGDVPGSELLQDVRDLDAWYTLNKDKLRWDAGLNTVVFEGLAPVPGTG